MDLSPDDNDTRRIFGRLEAGETVDEVLSGIEGPYASLFSIRTAWLIFLVALPSYTLT